MYDVVIVGGGAAGLNAAQMLGRARRSVMVIDGGEPRNAPAEAVHGFLSRDGISPVALLKAGRAEVESYGGQVLDGQVTAIERTDGERGESGAFKVMLQDGTGQESTVHGRRLLITTGLVDGLPEVPGIQELWGKDVLHCPYCHGWEVRDREIGILGTGPMAVFQALLFRQWSSNITLFLNGSIEPDEAELEQLAARNITVVHGAVERLQLEQGRLSGLQLATGGVVSIDALAVAPVFTARTQYFSGLGLRIQQHPSGMGEYVETDADGATAVPGVWAAGNVADLRAQVLSSAAAGAAAAVAINSDLMAEELQAAVAAYRQRVSV
ncbi:NAD(P)/FAD-dependent oxidoreductase [Arthrobacter rhizosphaerae]|uniref:NAD(P)/FAD-dependent oxidoreductase n=1 Tax=Arthrobacter rhizosphaerae TaxID=2855490 RepID=UPI001FF54BAB|nr:NAD(P)/FAD-dependent oxidoreductase [Arthrobacter rhizosphaerae]